jgi:DNA gyrase inhibitor GyrI
MIPYSHYPVVNDPITKRRTMNQSVDALLSVSLKDLPTVHVAYISCKANPDRGDLSDEIRESFQRVQAWVRELGYDPYTTLTIGIPNVVNGQLANYECCEQIPEEVKSGTDEISIKELVGGRYAVVNIEKEPALIGDSIRRFYQEYAPQNELGIDGARPVYEIYYENRMEYCVPIL